MSLRIGSQGLRAMHGAQSDYVHIPKVLITDVVGSLDSEFLGTCTDYRVHPSLRKKLKKVDPSIARGDWQ